MAVNGIKVYIFDHTQILGTTRAAFLSPHHWLCLLQRDSLMITEECELSEWSLMLKSKGFQRLLKKS